MERFQDNIIVITGAGSGIGAATTKRFAAEGAHVVLVGRTRDKLETLAAELPDLNQAFVRPADVSDPDQVQGLFADVSAQYGRLDVLVNNAGVAAVGEIGQISIEDWRQIMAINADSVFYCCRAALPYLSERKGVIVNTSSVSGIGGDWGMPAYTASKGAVTNFTRSLALDYASHGVRVNAVDPSLTRSDITEDMFADEELMAKFAERIPMGRGAYPEEVGDVIAFLASADARFVNGVNLPVDGGLTASNGQPKQV